MLKIIPNLTQAHTQDSFGEIINNLPDVIYARSARHDSNLSCVTENISEITGYSATEIGTLSWSGLIAKNDIAGYIKNLEHAVKTAQPFYCSYHIHTKNGELKLVFDHAKPVFNDRAEVVAFNGILSVDRASSHRGQLCTKTQNCHFRLLAENSKDLMFRYNCADNELEYISPASIVMTGYTPEDFYADRELLSRYLRVTFIDFAKSTSNELIVNRWVKKDGSELWVEMQYIPILGDTGEVVAIEGVVRDITSRKATETELSEKQRALSTLLSNLPGIAYRCKNDRNWTMEFVSAGCKILTGHDYTDFVVNKSIAYADLIQKDDRRRVWASIQLALEKKELFRIIYRICTPMGLKWVFEQGQGVYGPDGSLQFLEGFISDITELKNAQAKFMESQEKFKNLIETSEDIVFQIDRKARVQYISPKVTELYGWHVDEIVGHKLTVTTPAVEMLKALKAIRVVLSGQKLKNFEINQKDKFGYLIPMEINASPVQRNGKIVGVHGIMRNISERKIREMELKRANEELKERDHQKNEFLSTISHEIRTPLCIFKNVLSNAKAGVLGPMSPKLFENIEISEQNVNRLSRIVNDFLDVAKLDAGKMRLDMSTFNVQMLINEVLESFSSVAQAKGLKLGVMMQESAIVIEADHDKLVQVLANLVGNSIKFTPSGGRIDIEVNSYGDTIAFGVKDTGKGIEKNDLEKLFNRFVQVSKILGSKEHGTGLGLAIVKELVEMHHGRVWAESKVGVGSNITFILPKKQPLTV